MRISQYFLATHRNVSSHINVISYQLMLRAGLIRKVSAGLYTWLPTGLRVLRKIEDIVRKEMNKIGGMEVILPIVQPAGLWKRSGRWYQYGPELLRFKNRSNQDFILSPTHEELISDIFYKELISYKRLPLIVYQIQNKFRDEIRPRFGVIRAREFIMKDGYSFHSNNESLQDTYNIMYQTYHNIFNIMGLNFHVVEADSGNIGGNVSHEFHALVSHGENGVVCSTEADSFVNIHLSKSVVSSCNSLDRNVMEDMRLITIHDVHTIIDVIEKYNLSTKNIIKTLIVRASKNFGSLFVALLIRFDHKLSYSKAEKLPQVSVPLIFASENEIHSMMGVNSSILGPVNLPIPYIADHNVVIMTNFISGANINNSYFFGINWGRDLPLPLVADLRQVVSDDVTSDRKSILNIHNSIEIGHIFQLGSKYLNNMKKKLIIQNNNKDFLNIQMGCYGIGISRVIPAIIEQNHDKYGIKWPVDILAPFFIAIIPINMYNAHYVATVSEKLYHQLSIQGIDVLLDDRNESPGVMFSDMDLIGIPHIVIVSSPKLNFGEVEYKYRYSSVKENIKVNEIVDFLLKKFFHVNK